MKTKMNKLMLLLVIWVMAFTIFAGVDEYDFTMALDSYTEITGGTILGDNNNDDESFNAIDLGFTFTYNDVEYTQVSIQTNGFLAMGPEVVTSNLAISAAIGTNNIVAAMNRDLKSRENGELMYLLSGIAPNRVLTVQWKNYRRSPSSCTNDVLNFQIQLHENGNQVVFSYGHITAMTVSSARSFQVGLRGDSNMDFYNRSTIDDWTATTAGTVNNASCRITEDVFPPEGLYFSFVPPAHGIPLTVGNGTSVNTAYGNPTPYGTFYNSFRQQYLIQMSELENLGGGEGNINSLAFNVETRNNCDPMKSFTIRMKHTDQMALNNTFETGNYDTVYIQDGFLPVEGWNVHTFSTPFYWNGRQNIIVEVITDLSSKDRYENSSVFYTPTSFRSCLRYQSNYNNGSSVLTGTTSSNRANIRFNMQALDVTKPPNPAIMVSPVNGATNVLSGTKLQWSPGGGVPTGYKVFFGTTNPPPFVEYTTQTSYLLNLESNAIYYWQIVPANINGSAVDCPIWSFTSAEQHVTIGDGDQIARMPMDFYYKTSLFETIYFQDELGFTSGNITGVVFFNNFVSTALNKRTKIWLASTDQNDLAANWVPATEMTLVFDGLVDYPSGENTVIINLQSPFMHTPGNLVMMVERPMDSGYLDYSDNFQCQVSAEMRTRKVESDTVIFDPAAPPAVTAIARFPKAAFFYTEQQIINDLGALNISGSQTPNVGTISDYYITIKNNGTETQNDYQVKLFKEGDIEVASVAGPTIESLQTLQVTVPWTPTETGSTYFYGKVVLAGDEIEHNNKTTNYPVDVQEAGIALISIGSDATANTTTGVPTPYGTYYKSFRQQYLWRASEIYDAGGAPGMITFLGFNVQNPNNCSTMPNFTIKMKSTDQNVLTTTFELGDYTQVFYHDDFVPTPGWNTHKFTTPFFWDGVANVLVDIHCTIIPGTYTQNASVCYTPTTGENTALRFQSNNVDAGTNATGTVSINRANVRFGLTTHWGSMSGIVTAIGTTLPGATVSIENTIFTATTDEDASYSLPFVPSGQQTVTASRYGYFDQSHDVTIQEGQNTIQDFVLIQRPTVTVNGLVIGSDDPDVGIYGSDIIFSNDYEILEAATTPQGRFIISGVQQNRTYQYTISATGYVSVTGQIYVGDVDLVLEDIVLNPLTNPVSLVLAQESASYETVDINWSLQGSELGGASNKKGPKGRSIIGYKVWRLQDGLQNDEESWDLLTPSPIGEINFTDSDWSSLEEEDYLWAVKLAYSSGGASNPVFSNQLPRRNPPQIILPIADILINMNVSHTLAPVESYFSTEYPDLHYEIDCKPIVDTLYLPDGSVKFTPELDWVGVTFLTIKAVDANGRYAVQNVRLTVWQTSMFEEDFNQDGDLPSGWNVAHIGNTSHPWQPYQVQGSNYAMKTSATLGNTALERLVSLRYDLSSLKEIHVSFDSSFLPYGSSTGVFAYSFNNVTYTTVEVLDTEFTGRKTYSIPALTGKPNVYFRWVYTNNTVNTGQSNHWIVDNFSVFGKYRDTLPPPTVSGLEVQGVGPGSVVLAWQPINDFYFNRYEIYVSEDEDINTSDMLWSTEDDPALRDMETDGTTLIGLEDGRYWAAIRALDQSGNSSPLSEPVTFTLDHEPLVLHAPLPSGQPLPEWSKQNEVAIGCNIEGSNVAPNSIMFRVDYNQNDIYDIHEAWQPYTGGGMEIVQNLPPLADGVYHFEFKVLGMNGVPAYSGTSSQEGIEDDWIFRIDTTPPAAIGTFFVGSVQDDAVELFWTPSSDLNFAGYRIFYAEHPEPGSEDMTWDHLNDPNLVNEGVSLKTTTIVGLNSGTRYYFVLEALDEAGWIRRSPDQITAMTTSSALPKAPENLRVHIDGDLLVLDWDEVTQDLNGYPIQVAHYEIFLSDDPYFECGPENYYDSYIAPPISLDYIVEYVDRLFIQVRAVTGAVRSKPVPAKKFGK